MQPTIVTIHDRFGEFVDLMSLASALEVYRFLSQSRIRHSIEVNGRAIGYSEDGFSYRLEVCG